METRGNQRNRLRLYAALCLAVCGGFLFGTFRERGTAKLAPSPTPLASLIAPEDELQRELGVQRASLTEATSDAERIAVARKLSDIGLTAHNRDKGRGSIAIAAFEDATATFRAAKAWRPLAETNGLLAQTLLLRGRTEEASALWRETSAIAPRVPDAAFAAAIELQAGEFFLDTGRLTDARAVLTKAQTAFAAQRDRKGVAHCQRYLGGVALEEGNLFVTRQESEAALTALLDLHDDPTVAAIRGTLGDVALSEGNLFEADRQYAAGLAYWRKSGQTFWTARFLSRRASLAAAQNQWDDAQALATESLRLLDTSDGPITRAYPLMVLGDVARARGDYDTAVRRHTEALSLWKRLGNPYRIRTAEAALRADGQATKRT